MLFLRLIENLRSRGHEVISVTREYRDVLNMLRMIGLEAKVIGRHGGGSLTGKLRASAERILGLTSYFEEEEPDLAVSFSSPEMARVAFGLRVPHLCINDSPHAEAVAKLTIPLSNRLLTPKIIPKHAWTRYGISPDRIRQYNALDPWAWLRGFKPDRKVLEMLNLSDSKPIITIRPEEEYAAYLMGKTNGRTTVIPLIEEILSRRDDIQVVAIPRYAEQTRTLSRYFQDRIIIPRSSIDGPSLLHYSSVFIGGGGTMTIEAALLGVPTLSFYPDEPFIILKYLIRMGLVRLERDPKRLADNALKIIENRDEERERQSETARKLTAKFEDPIQVIADEIERNM